MDLIFPSSFVDWQKTAAQKMLRGLPVIEAQMLVDEVAGRLAAGRVKRPISYLGCLVSSWRDGSFVPRYGVSVAEARTEARARVQAASASRVDALKAAVADMEAAKGGSWRDDEIERRRAQALARINPSADPEVRAAFERMINAYFDHEYQKRRSGGQTGGSEDASED